MPPEVFLLDPRGAVPEYVGALAAGLRAEGRPVTVLTTREVSARVGAATSAPVHALWTLRRNGGVRNLVPYGLGWLRAVALIARARRRGVVLHMQWPVRPRWEGALLRALGRLPRVATVHTAHNVVPHDSDADGGFASLYASVDALVVHSRKSDEELVERWPELAGKERRRIPHGNYAWAARPPAASTGAIGIVGSVRPYKGTAAVVRVARALGCGLVVAGRPDAPAYAAEVAAAAAELPSARIVLRQLSLDELVDSCLALDVLVLPYEEIDKSGILLLGMTLGRAIVAYDLPSFHETLGDDAALLVPRGDEDALRDAVARVLGDPGLRARLGESAARIARERHGWDEVARQHAELYDAVAAA